MHKLMLRPTLRYGGCCSAHSLQGTTLTLHGLSSASILTQQSYSFQKKKFLSPQERLYATFSSSKDDDDDDDDDDNEKEEFDESRLSQHLSTFDEDYEDDEEENDDEPEDGEDIDEDGEGSEIERLFGISSNKPKDLTLIDLVERREEEDHEFEDEDEDFDILRWKMEGDNVTYDGDYYNDTSFTKQLPHPEITPEKRSVASIPPMGWEHNFRANPWHPKDWPREFCQTLRVGRHTKITRGGRIFSYSALVMNGNGKGTGGYGYGKAATVPEAIKRAHDDCMKNLITIDLYKDRALAEPIQANYNKSICRLFIHPLDRFPPPCNKTMELVLASFGIANVSGKFMGRAHRLNRIKALYLAIQLVEHPDTAAERLGQKFFNPNKVYHRNGKLWTYD